MIINEKMKEVPFGNSAFQIIHFTAKHETPERSYRSILLQLDSKNKVMQECYFRRKRREIDIREINEKLKTTISFDKERLEIDLEEAEYGLEAEIKLIEDCVFEIKVYEKLLEDLPEFTRENFENGERNYWKLRLIRQADLEFKTTGNVGTGTLDSMDRIGCFVQRNETGQLMVYDTIDGQIEDKNEKDNQ